MSLKWNSLSPESGLWIPLAGPANKQARICADNIAGDRKRYEGSLGTSAAQCFDLTAAAVGLNEKALLGLRKNKRPGLSYHTDTAEIHAAIIPVRIR